MSPQQKKYLSLALKLLVLLTAGYIIYQKTSTHSDFRNFIITIKEFSLGQSIFYLAILFLLMLLNWGLEAGKWRFLLRKIEPQTYWETLSAVFCGLTWAIFTPNRIGEYGGRVFFLRPSRRLPAVFAMGIGTISQLIVTNICGIIAGIIYLNYFEHIDFRMTWGLSVFGLTIITVLLLVYFHIRLLKQILLSFSFTRKFKKFYSILARYSKSDLLRIITYSFVRYLVFTLQYVVLFHWLIPEIPAAMVVLLIAVFFFVQAYLPSLAIVDLGVRSLTGLYFFNMVSQQNSAIVACFALIWFINIIVPAIMGFYFVFKLKFFGND